MVTLNREADPTVCSFLGKTEADTFHLKCKVAVHVGGGTTSETKDEVAQRWRLKVVQDIVAVSPGNTTYLGSVQTDTTAPIPGQDRPSGDGWPAETFGAHLDTKEVTFFDSPGYRGILLWLPGVPGSGIPVTPGIGPLEWASRDDTFVTWVYAEDQQTFARVFLKWVKWKAKWRIDFNVNLVNGITVATWNETPSEFEKLSEGSGQGPQGPTFQPVTFGHTDSRVP